MQKPWTALVDYEGEQHGFASCFLFATLGSLRLRLLNSLRRLGAIIGVSVSGSLSSNELVVPESLYMYIQDALVLWEQLEANTSDEDLQSKYSYVRHRMDLNAMIQKMNNDLPSDWSLSDVHLSGQVPDSIRPVLRRIETMQATLPSEGQTEDEQQPSNILCISYPPVVHMDEQKLHNAMILFGEIENITSFPSKLCSYVEFRSMEEANLAKERLQGKLFSDPRILITFSPNDPTANQTGGLPYQAPQLNVSGQPLLPNCFNGHAIPHGVGGPHTSRPYFPPGGFDSSQIQREPKRLRTEGTMAYGGKNDPVLLANQISRGVPQVKGLVHSNTRFTNTSPDIIGSPTPDANYIWRGVIAKGGNRICHARCVPVGDWIGYEL
ncbi:Nucleotide-binding, alpha-beta plait [Artemisia annua]|uniref:Nucleotide-binding, alpha-beta plait n=1 Tax=Artemisia annua TaxID=35608 RepID=A0A2U1MZV1_ARTAN|nr:Nucleotide-binding, alpha-beta plait [Artemisia annua]